MIAALVRVWEDAYVAGAVDAPGADAAASRARWRPT